MHTFTLTLQGESHFQRMHELLPETDWYIVTPVMLRKRKTLAEYWYCIEGTITSDELVRVVLTLPNIGKHQLSVRREK